MSKLSLKIPDEGDSAPAPTQPGSASMETAEVMVRLGGDIRNEVPVSHVTPAELILLRAIHGGAETVVVKQIEGVSSLSAAGERMRLLGKYARHHRTIIEMFPGLAPQFPLRIQEAEALAQQELSAGENDAQINPLET